jgi:hypothetical protein
MNFTPSKCIRYAFDKRFPAQYSVVSQITLLESININKLKKSAQQSAPASPFAYEPKAAIINVKTIFSQRNTFEMKEPSLEPHN